MKRSQPVRFTCFSIILLTGFLLAGGLSPARAADPAKQRFMGKIQSALDARDVSAFKKLFNWEGVGEQVTHSLNKHLFKRLFDNPIETVRFVPLSKDFRTEYVVNGIRHFPNVKIAGLVEIKYKEGAQGRTAVKMPYGIKGGRYLFAGTIQETVNLNAPETKQLQVIIIGMGHPPVTFEGYMLYLENEKPIRKELKDMGGGNLTQMVRGDDITLVKVWRTSAKGTLQIEILVDGKTIHKTHPTDTDQPIVFRKP